MHRELEGVVGPDLSDWSHGQGQADLKAAKGGAEMWNPGPGGPSPGPGGHPPHGPTPHGHNHPGGPPHGPGKGPGGPHGPPPPPGGHPPPPPPGGRQKHIQYKGLHLSWN
ncbi:proline-rich protein HaeIII subfamily 1-like isoform X3 [Trichosurus vulpecula]|uniref:proline-rich protein HaeIII subfamily 1-like isoform X3 n=1 Tax=Trichosurus vulpecula TaxID=9337 RepID=UPI00186AF11B|nr:proline-rich protein HaeIII subfamily 1-like isoform X3 [Trichosurus vulpecula]